MPHYKHYFLLVLFFLIYSSKAQESIRFDESGLDLVIQRSKVEKKPIFYMIYANWCVYCNNIKQNVLKDPEVVSFINSNYIFAGLDFEKKDRKNSKKNIKLHPSLLL